MSSAKWRLFGLGLNELKHSWQPYQKFINPLMTQINEKYFLTEKLSDCIFQCIFLMLVIVGDKVELIWIYISNYSWQEVVADIR